MVAPFGLCPRYARACATDGRAGSGATEEKEQVFSPPVCVTLTGTAERSPQERPVHETGTVSVCGSARFFDLPPGVTCTVMCFDCFRDRATPGLFDSVARHQEFPL